MDLVNDLPIQKWKNQEVYLWKYCFTIFRTGKKRGRPPLKKKDKKKSKKKIIPKEEAEDAEDDTAETKEDEEGEEEGGEEKGEEGKGEEEEEEEMEAEESQEWRGGAKTSEETGGQDWLTQQQGHNAALSTCYMARRRDIFWTSFQC